MIHHLKVILVGSIFLTGCSSVAPWDRGILSREEMAWDLNKHETSFQGHMYSSKEAASGGVGPAGGGCGCN